MIYDILNIGGIEWPTSSPDLYGSPPILHEAEEIGVCFVCSMFVIYAFCLGVCGGAAFFN